MAKEKRGTRKWEMAPGKYNAFFVPRGFSEFQTKMHTYSQACNILQDLHCPTTSPFSDILIFFYLAFITSGPMYGHYLKIISVSL